MIVRSYAQPCINMRSEGALSSALCGQLVTPNDTALKDSHGQCQRCGARFRPGVLRAVSRPSRGGFVLLHNARWDAPALADRNTPVFRPRADIRAALTARCGTYRSASLASSSLAGMFDVGRDLPAERAGILLI